MDGPLYYIAEATPFDQAFLDWFRAEAEGTPGEDATDDVITGFVIGMEMAVQHPEWVAAFMAQTTCPRSPEFADRIAEEVPYKPEYAAGWPSTE